MPSRRFSALSATALALALGACAGAPAAVDSASAIAAGEPAADAQARLYALFKASDEAAVSRNPVSAFFRGDFSRADTLGPLFDPAVTEATIAAAQHDLAALHTIDRAALSADDRIAYDVFEYNQKSTLELQRPELRRFAELLPLDHFNGFHIQYPYLSSPGGVMPFDTVADYENALKRHAEIPAIFDRATALMRQGMAQGVVQPRLTVEAMIGQLDTQLALATDDSPYLTPVKNFPDAIAADERTRLTADYRKAYEGELRPALEKLRSFLKTEYLPAARDGIGLGATAGGPAYYDYMIDQMTTLPLTADEVHATGLAEVARINAALAKARSEAGTRTPVAYRDKAALTQAWYDLAKKVDPRLPQLFSDIPRTPLQIKPYEEYREAFNLAASYNPGNAQTGKPGTFYFSGYNLANRTVSPSIALYMHEGNPGHHFQTMLTFENEQLPAFLRYGGFTAFSEGWGLYAESLGYELGLYEDPLDRIGALAGGELLRAVRLVVDTGIHAKGWSRQQAIDYMIANGQAPEFAASEVNRYSVMPGQALAYKTGELAIKRLRKKAEAALGPRFDVRAFHREVLDTGDLPLPVLEAKIDQWIADGGK